MPHRRARWVVLVPALAGLLLTACVGGQSKPPNFYTLIPEASVEEGSTASEIGARPVLALGPVRLPDYLQRPQIVTRGEGARIERAEFERWAGALEDQVTAALVANLSVELDDIAVLSQRQDWVDPAYRVSIDVEDLSGRLGGHLDLRASWLVMRTGGEDQARLVKSSQIRVPVAGPDYGALVEAHKEALKVLSGQIAEAVRRL